MTKPLTKRVFCNVCGAVRICHGRSRYAVCPKGHGRLVPRFTREERRKAIVAKLPKAHRAGRRTFRIDGHDGLFRYRNGCGRQPAEPDTQLTTEEVLACYVSRDRAFVRVFARKLRHRTNA
jgi:hypothetical protein